MAINFIPFDLSKPMFESRKPVRNSAVLAPAQASAINPISDQRKDLPVTKKPPSKRGALAQEENTDDVEEMSGRQPTAGEGSVYTSHQTADHQLEQEPLEDTNHQVDIKV